ncbi:hypothetical protein [Amycolatopsis sp. GA6-003]|uniref:hypothetical protein n=1 Tax=Amycolatopsis sp. GA6-003 TaxID=2652444 RepID=UPI0039172F7F
MKIMAFSDVLAAFHSASTDSLATQADQIIQAAQKQGLRVLPGRVDASSLVELDSAALAADEVVTAAATAGTQLLYLRRVVLDQATVDAVLEGVEASAERTTARKALARIVGWTGCIEVGFAHHGVLHLWEASMPWHDSLEELSMSEPSEMGHDSFEDVRLDEGQIAELAGQLAASQEFRRARWSEREAVAEQLPVLAALKSNPKIPRWTVSSVIGKASDVVRLQADDCATALEARKEELAAALAADSKFSAIRTAEARLRFTETWIRNHSDGLPIGHWLLKELVKLAVDTRKKGNPTQLTL